MGISPLAVGSMSHLAKNGLNFYAPILVEAMTRMAGRVGPGVNVIPLLLIPVGGIGGDPAAGHDGPGLLDRVHWSRAGHRSA